MAKLYPIKIQKQLEARKDSKLNLNITTEMLISGQRKQSHFMDIVDRGKKDIFFFLVIELIEKRLANIKAVQRTRCLTLIRDLEPDIGVCEACEDLHMLGIIHRDFCQLTRTLR